MICIFIGISFFDKEKGTFVAFDINIEKPEEKPRR